MRICCRVYVSFVLMSVHAVGFGREYGDVGLCGRVLVVNSTVTNGTFVYRD
jgi:hypothetical protein